MVEFSHCSQNRHQSIPLDWYTPDPTPTAEASTTSTSLLRSGGDISASSKTSAHSWQTSFDIPAPPGLERHCNFNTIGKSVRSEDDHLTSSPTAAATALHCPTNDSDTWRKWDNAIAKKNHSCEKDWKLSPELTTAAPTPYPLTPPDSEWTATTSTPPLVTSVWVCVEGVGFRYRLTSEDVDTVFSRYGIVSSVAVSPDGLSAIVSYKYVNSAGRAIQDLHGKTLTGINGRLSVTFAPQAAAGSLDGRQSTGCLSPFPCLPPLDEGAYRQQQPFQPHSQQHIQQRLTSRRNNIAAFHADAKLGGKAFTLPSISPHGTSTEDLPRSPPDNLMADGRIIRKYTARFDIGIVNDGQFQVARRIIGSRGANMKRIVSVCDAKLRLRGQGSGFLEGAENRECPEPLHLCISCREYEGFSIAVRMTADLLLSVYSQYYHFCAAKNIPCQELALSVRELPLVETAPKTGAAAGGAGGHGFLREENFL